MCWFVFFQAEDGIRDLVRSRGLGDVYKRQVKKYMQGIFHDWQAEELTAVLHEHRGGHAWSRQAIHGLAIKAEREDAQLIVGPTVTGFRFNSACLLYTSPSPRDRTRSRMPSSA